MGKRKHNFEDRIPLISLIIFLLPSFGKCTFRYVNILNSLQMLLLSSRDTHLLNTKQKRKRNITHVIINLSIDKRCSHLIHASTIGRWKGKICYSGKKTLNYMSILVWCQEWKKIKKKQLWRNTKFSFRTQTLLHAIHQVKGCFHLRIVTLSQQLIVKLWSQVVILEMTGMLPLKIGMIITLDEYVLKSIIID